ncbi:MAG: CcdB family protein [Alkalispirochaetaceae bacterium]
MAQFDIHLNSDERTRERTPYLLDVQSELLSDLATRIVVPLRPVTEEEPWMISRLHPVITHGEKSYAAVVSELAGIPVGLLSGRVGDAGAQRADIIAAIDLLITGF